MRSKFSRRSYKQQQYIDGVRVTRKMLRALAKIEQEAAAAEALKQKRAAMRRIKREADAKVREAAKAKTNEAKEE